MKHTLRILQGTTTTTNPRQEANDPIRATLVPTRLASLFPQQAKKSLSKKEEKEEKKEEEEKLPVVYELHERSLESQIHKSVYQAFAQVPRRHERVPLEDEEFFQNDKVRRTDLQRKTFRTGTRPKLRDSWPERKSPLSSLLKPPMPLEHQHRSIVFVHPPTTPNPKTAAPSAPSLLSGTGSTTTTFPFPGSIPISLMRADIPQLYDGALYYVWSWKANGLRFLLVAGTFYGHRLLLLVNRARQIFVVPGTVPSLLFDGTILDGELVRHRDGRFSFLVYDAVMTSGVPCGEYNYLVRLQTASLLLHAWTSSYSSVQEEKSSASKKNAPPPPPPPPPFELLIKPVYAPEQIADVLETVVPELDYEIDGLVATAVEPPVEMGQTNTLKKYKRGTDHTIDLIAVCCAAPPNETGKQSQEMEIDLLAARGAVGAGWAHWTTTTSSRIDAGCCSSSSLIHERIVECRYHPPDETWHIESVRADKLAPNKLSTAWKTWQNIRENLSLLHVFPKDSVSDEVRERLRQWEASHTRWQKAPPPPPPPAPATFSTIRPMAPLPLHQASSFI